MKNSENKESCEASSSAAIPGCGSETGYAPINLNITTTTGGNFSVLVDVQNSVENLKKIIAKKLKVAKDRICLLHRERELQDGNLKENGLVDGSKIILIPSVETGLLAQRPENTVMQALESLNDAQVNDFLSGKTPLNLSMRLGDHMMLIQLQLSTVSPSSPPHNRSRPRSRSGRSSTTSSSSSSSSSTSNRNENQLQQNTSKKPDSEIISKENNGITQDNPASLTTTSVTQDRSLPVKSMQEGELNSFLNKHGFESIHEIVKNFSTAQSSSGRLSSKSFENKTMSCCSASVSNHSYNNVSVMDQSPIKSLSNLVSNPLKTVPVKGINNSCIDELDATSDIERASLCSDPISAKLTSCLCKRLDGTVKECETNQCQTKQVLPNTVVVDHSEQIISNTPNVKSLNSTLLHKTINNPISKIKSRHHSSACKIWRKNIVSVDRKNSHKDSTVISKSDSSCGRGSSEVEETRPGITATDARALAEASRNLTQTLRKLSKEVFTNKVDLSEQPPRKSNSGAVIESMKNHGKGIYSGTFSGTLNPALQDQYGRPKRDISTVIHILNDLLSATPQYNRETRIHFEPSSSSSGKSNNKQAIKHFSTPDQECRKCASTSTPKSNTCAYGECNGHTTSVTSPILSTSNTSESHYVPFSCHDYSSLKVSTSDNSSYLNLSDNKSLCTCNNSSSNSSTSSSNNSYRNQNEASSEIRNNTTMCSKCSIELENSKTKCKLDQLRLVMQQKKQKREARKLKGAPYGARMLSTHSNSTTASNSTSTGTTTAAATTNTITSIAPPTEVSPNHIVEEVDTAA